MEVPVDWPVKLEELPTESLEYTTGVEDLTLQTLRTHRLLHSPIYLNNQWTHQ